MAEIDLLISVDWEGTDLEGKNLSRIKEFKKKWGAPLTHYLNPSYFTNPKLKKIDSSKKMKSVLFDEDEIGLHLHTPKHLLKAVGIVPRNGPYFSRYGDYNDGDEHGQEMMLHGYSSEELESLISFSKNIYQEKGFRHFSSFRAGGWMSSEHVFEALFNQEIFVESSATVASLLNQSSWEGDNLQRYIRLLWEHINEDSVPYRIPTAKGSIVEIPNNLGAIDYWKDDWIEGLAERCVQNAFKKGRHLAVINSHQETALGHWDKMDCFIDLLKKDPDVKLNFITNREITPYCS